MAERTTLPPHGSVEKPTLGWAHPQPYLRNGRNGGKTGNSRIQHELPLSAGSSRSRDYALIVWIPASPGLVSGIAIHTSAAAARPMAARVMKAVELPKASAIQPATAVLNVAPTPIIRPTNPRARL